MRSTHAQHPTGGYGVSWLAQAGEAQQLQERLAQASVKAQTSKQLNAQLAELEAQAADATHLAQAVADTKARVGFVCLTCLLTMPYSQYACLDTC